MHTTKKFVSKSKLVPKIQFTMFVEQELDIFYLQQCNNPIEIHFIFVQGPVGTYFFQHLSIWSRQLFLGNVYNDTPNQLYFCRTNKNVNES